MDIKQHNISTPLIKIEDRLLWRLVEKHGLPLHVVFEERFAQNVEKFNTIIEKLYPKTLLCFAVKSNPCRGAVRMAAKFELGVDVVSEFELRAALAEGIQPKKIVCNGNVKSDHYLDGAIAAGALIAADSEWELNLISAISRFKECRTKVLLRFSGMPLEGFTSPEQSTASQWTKFGFPVSRAYDIFKFVSKLPNIETVGISAHIGTQICDPMGYARLMIHVFNLMNIAQKHRLRFSYIDIGGGFPVNYLTRKKWIEFERTLREQLTGNLETSEIATWDNTPMGFKYLNGMAPRVTDPWVGKAYWSEAPGAEMLKVILLQKITDGKSVQEHLEAHGNPTLIIEPGRSLIGTAGITVARAAGVKTVNENNVLALELGIVNHGTNLITDDIFPVEVRPQREKEEPLKAFLAGRLCFSGDMISKVKVSLNRMPRRSDLVVLHHTGAYCADHFASNSCGFPRPAKVAVCQDGSTQLWRPADKFEDMFSTPEAFEKD